jgi:hypothetical protein
MSRPRHAFGQQPGRLVATMLRALAAELSEPGRYARGKAYARDGAVIDIDIREGSIGGLVLGSRPDPYQARILADAAPADELERAGIAHAATMSLLIPGRDELAVSCTCPDAVGTLCKHAVAVLLVFADETSIEPDLLVRWRSPADDRSGVLRPALPRLTPRGRVPGDQSSHRYVATVTARATPAAPAARVDVLAGLLEPGAELPALPEISRHRTPPPPPLALTDPVVRLVHELTESALDAMTRGGR